MKFFKIMYLFVIVLLSVNVLSAGVLTQLDVNLNDYGQFNNEMSFNNNPVSVGNVESKSIELGYMRFYNGTGYNLNAFSLSGAVNLNYVKAGLGVGYFKDSDSIVDYNEFKIRFAAASDYLVSKYIRNLMIGIGVNISLENMSINYNENLISGNTYKNSEFNLDSGISYSISRLKLGIGIKDILTNPYIIGGIGYQFGRVSVVGVSLKYKDDDVDLSLGFSNSIIDNVLDLYMGLSGRDITTGVGFKIFSNIIKTGKMIFNYTLNYNFMLKDTHYVSVKYEF